MTNRERMLKAMKGERADRLVFAPRLDLWYNANKYRNTLPKEHQDRQTEEIAKVEGWANHRMVPEFLAGPPEETIDRALNIYRVKECPYRAELPDDVQRVVWQKGERKHVEYRTPIGSIGCTLLYTSEMRAAGASLFWVDERLIKRPQDYKILGYIYRNMKVLPAYDRFQKWMNEVWETGIACANANNDASPLHLIQRDILDATEFYFHYKDYHREMMGLVEDLEPFFEKILNATADCPAEVVLWGANFDDMITYPALFKEHFLPWLRRVSAVLRKKGKITVSHCDGENQGLMDLVLETGIDVAESVCPHPMTKVTMQDYYRKWGKQITIFGGIPSVLVLDESTSEKEFEQFLENLFGSIAPGDRIILGVADTVPPNANFARLRRIGKLVEEMGQLPLAGRDSRLDGVAAVPKAGSRPTSRMEGAGKNFPEIQESLFAGEEKEIRIRVEDALRAGERADEILHHGLIPAMELIGERFKNNDVFIPEVLLSARAMNEALSVLEPFLSEKDHRVSGTVLLGTVKGDVHDIGKNLVGVMLKGAGFRIHDLGINVSKETFVQKIQEIQPDIVALSALLTTTMPQMKEVIDEIFRAGLRSQVKIMVGGAPVNRTFATGIGADGYGSDAGDALILAKEMMASKEG